MLQITPAQGTEILQDIKKCFFKFSEGKNIDGEFTFTILSNLIVHILFELGENKEDRKKLLNSLLMGAEEMLSIVESRKGAAENLL